MGWRSKQRQAGADNNQPESSSNISGNGDRGGSGDGGYGDGGDG
jgi:hypothetical protein